MNWPADAGFLLENQMITQPWQDDRILMNGKYIGCVTKENADLIMMMQDVIIQLAKAPEHGLSFVLQMQAKSILEDLK
jgi:hypothetical protein